MPELREYTVTIERSDRDMPDPIDVFAADRDDAIRTIKHIYRCRCQAIVSAHLKKPDRAQMMLTLNKALLDGSIVFAGIPVLDAHPALPKEVTP